MQRIICPNPTHIEKTPSCVVYDEYVHCFGCGYHAPISSLVGEARLSRPTSRPTDIKSELERIKALPFAPVRGLSLPVDGDSYYILWPGDVYYKRRKFLPGTGPKYVNPRGHEKPLFVPRETKGCTTLAIVEGEINALSLASINPPFDVCSPGSCTDFGEKILNKNYKYFTRYTRFYVTIDKDNPGLTAAIKLKTLLLKRSPYVEVKMLKRDCNELLVSGELKEIVSSWGSA